jgi:hypothetical protein
MTYWVRLEVSSFPHLAGGEQWSFPSGVKGPLGFGYVDSGCLGASHIEFS